MSKQIIIDCDPGLDDAVALLAAFASPDLDMLAVTTVAGNVKGPQTAMNARIIRHIAGLDAAGIPVCAGAPRPILRDQVTAEDFHGSTGLGNIPFPDPDQPLSSTHAVSQIVESCRTAKRQPITLVITGPMTNIALALIMVPDIVHDIEEVVLMGGADSEGGNITPRAEFNVFADPHAADIIFSSGLPIRVLNLDVTHQIRTTEARLEAIRTLGSPQAKATADLLEASCKLEWKAKKARAAPLHDPSTIIALLRPELFDGCRGHVSVVTQPGESFGQTQVTYAEGGPVLWYQTADSDGVFAELTKLLETYE